MITLDDKTFCNEIYKMRDSLLVDYYSTQLNSTQLTIKNQKQLERRGASSRFVDVFFMQIEQNNFNYLFDTQEMLQFN